MCPQIGVRTYGPSVLDRRLGCRFRNVIPGRLDEVDARRWHVESAAVWLMSTVLEDAQQAIGHGVRAKRSKSGAITFELLDAEDSHATV